MDKERLYALLEEATVDCYGEEEEFAGILYTLENRLNFPLRAKALGELVEVVGLDDARSGLRGIIAWVRKADRQYPAVLAELEFVDLDPVGAEWLEVYQYWLG